jgi:branched-chain amino acid transport system substrate-binding protein
MDRRKLLLSGAAATMALGASQASAEEPRDIVIGCLYPKSGDSKQVGIDAEHALNTAAEIINGKHKDKNFDDLPLAKGAGLPGLSGAKIKLVFADHQADLQKGRTEAERLIVQGKACALIGSYQSAVAATISLVAERYQVPYLSASSSSPSLHRRNLKFFFRPGPHDVMFSEVMFKFFNSLRDKGKTIEKLALFHEDTIFGTDSAAAQTDLAKSYNYKIVADIKSNSPSLEAELQQLKDADVVMPSCYTADAELLINEIEKLPHKPAIVAQDAGFADQKLYDRVGDKVYGLISRGSFAPNLAGERKMIGVVNGLFKARSGKNLNDLTSREFMGLIVLADAINRAQSTDGEKIRAALAATDLPGERTIMPWRRVKFDENGQNTYADPVLLQWRKNEITDESGKKKDGFVTIFPDKFKARDADWPTKAA